jgi:alkylhydroperoxidase family enzyme
MSFISTTPTADATGAVLEMYQRQEDFWGYVPNYAKPFSHRPEVMARWGRLLAEVRRPVDDRRFEIVTLAVALELKHSACSLAHGRKLAHIIGNDDVIRVAKGEDAESLSEAEVAIMAFARKIARDASKITRGDVEVLTKIHGLSDEDVFDIAAIASARCFFTKILDALGSEPDASFMKIDPALRQSLAVGRPISVTGPEYTPARQTA